VEKGGEMAAFGRCVGGDPHGVESKAPKGVPESKLLAHQRMIKFRSRGDLRVWVNVEDVEESFFRCRLYHSQRRFHCIRVAHLCEVCEATLQRSGDEEVLGLCCKRLREGDELAYDLPYSVSFGAQVVAYLGGRTDGGAGCNKALLGMADIRSFREYSSNVECSSAQCAIQQAFMRRGGEAHCSPLFREGVDCQEDVGATAH
jgi:hypothetical protein